MTLKDKKPNPHVIIAANEFAKTCAMYGYDGMTDLICSKGEPDCLYIDGKTFICAEGKWAQHVRGVPRG
jgi:hypothetical protein